MTELELKLMLLRYNMLSKKEAEAAYKCVNADDFIGYEDEWAACLDKLAAMRRELRNYGYEFAYTGCKTADNIKYRVYKVVPIANR